VKHCIFGSGTSASAAVRIATNNNDLTTMGTIDSNSVAGAVGTINPYWTFSTGGGDPGTFRTPAAWTTAVGYDAHSTFQTGNLFLVMNPSNVTNTYYISGVYKNLSNGNFFNSVTLAPYNSILLILQNYGQRFRAWKVSSMQHP
jgi:hypothetical protein